MKLKSIFLSHIVTEKMPSYGNRDGFFVRINTSISAGTSSNSSSWYFSTNHIGTHIDMPKHFFDQGKGLSDLTSDDLIFYNVCIIDISCTSGRLITSDDFINHHSKIVEDVELLLIRTGYEAFRATKKYWNDNPGISSNSADYLRTEYPKLRCVGFDFISLTSWKFRSEGKMSHKTFLCPRDNKRSIFIIEDMALAHAGDKIESVIISPLIVENGNGGPVTVIALTNQSNLL